jgi:uncharacterized repeat protein (TIGR02543 family)
MLRYLFLPSNDRGTHSFRRHLSRAGRLFMSLLVLLSLLGRSATTIQAATPITFTAEELLGKPEDTSITVNIVPASTIEYHYQYGTSSGVYTWETANYTATAGQPHEIVISGLTANTQYFYRMQYHAPGDAMDDWVNRTEHSFWTQRAPGSTFVFDIVSDSHAMYNAQYQQACQNIAADHPDFVFDLGDTFMTDGMTSQTAVNNAYLAQREPLYFDAFGHSAALFLASGNHENEEGWNLDDTPFSIAVASVKARKLYYPTPIDDGFYSGNTDPLPDLDIGTYGDQYREDYYAWTWGDALFVVFDPFQYTMQNPYGATAGEGNDDPAIGDRWNWTLGLQQYNWLKQVLENSNAKYKFMFAHHMLGGTQNYVRGGAVPAHMFEWGGYNADGTTWGWDTKRPGWGDDPIRQLMIDNHVSGFFHGHDHQYAYEVRDGIVYLSMPRPSTGLDFNYYSESDPYTERVIASPGHLRVTITPDLATFEYVRSNQTAVSHTFTIEPNITGPTHVLTTAVNPGGSGTISPSAGTHTYAEGTVVPVTASANAGYTFSNWSGACTGSGPCSVTMDDDKSVTANFSALPSYNLTMAVSPGGAGTTDPAVGVHPYYAGTVVTVTATAGIGYAFSSWSGACGGSGSCVVTMDANKSVTANFVATGVASAATPSNGTPTTGQQVVVSINVDMSSSAAPDDLLGSFSGSLSWNPAVLSYNSNSGLLGGFTGAINTANTGSGQITFNGANATGATGNTVVFQITFDAVALGTSALDLEYSAMAAAYSFTDLLPILTVTDGQVVVSSSHLGDVNGDGVANSTDALIILSADVGMNTAAFCPMNCGDVDGEGHVNSTDALIILSYDVGMSVPFAVGTGPCPSSVTQPPGCS